MLFISNDEYVTHMKQNEKQKVKNHAVSGDFCIHVFQKFQKKVYCFKIPAIGERFLDLLFLDPFLLANQRFTESY